MAELIGSLLMVAIVTTLVLPGRPTPKLLDNGSTAVRNIIRASIGM